MKCPNCGCEQFILKGPVEVLICGKCGMEM